MMFIHKMYIQQKSYRTLDPVRRELGMTTQHIRGTLNLSLDGVLPQREVGFLLLLLLGLERHLRHNQIRRQLSEDSQWYAARRVAIICWNK